MWEPMKVKLGALVPIIMLSLVRGLKVLIVGNPGIGKTEVIKMIVGMMPPYIPEGKPAVLLNWFLAQEQEENVDGIPFKCTDENGDYVKQLPFEKQRTNLLYDDRFVVNFLDDMLQGSTRKQTSHMQFWGGHIFGENVADNIRFIGATNDVKMKAGATAAIEPLKSRCTTIYHAVVDHPFWEKWAINSGRVRPDIIAYLHQNPQALDQFNPTVNLTNSPCPRTWVSASDILNICEETEADNYTTKASVEGSIGNAEMLQFFAFKTMVDQAATPEVILADPHGVRVPENASVMYAVCLALVNVCDTVEKAEFAMQYAKRLPAEFESLMVKQMAGNVEGMKHTKEYVDYLSRRGETLL